MFPRGLYDAPLFFNITSLLRIITSYIDDYSFFCFCYICTKYNCVTVPPMLILLWSPADNYFAFCTH